LSSTKSPSELLKHWILELLLGNEIDDEGWIEIRQSIAELSTDETDQLTGLILEVLAVLDQSIN